MSVSFHVGGGSMGTQLDDTARHGLDDELRQGVDADLPRQHPLRHRPHLRGRVPPVPRPEARVGRVRRRLDPERARGVRLAVAQRRRPRRAPRVRPAAERVLPAPDLRLLLVRGAGRARRRSRATRTTSSTRPTTRTRPASTPGPARPAQRPRDYATRVLGGLPDDVLARCCTTTRPRSTACERRRSARRPSSARRASSPRSRGRVLHLRIDRVERRNAFTQDMYRAIKRAAVWADEQPELDAVCLTGTDALVRRRW